MNAVNLICPHCGKDQLLEPECMENDEQQCSYCKKLIHEEPEAITGWTFLRIVKIGSSKVVMLSEDGKLWKTPEEVYGLLGNFDLQLVIEQGPNAASLLVKSRK